jgi:hypothetical protein
VNDHLQVTVALVFYHTVALCLGFGFAFLGYRLFETGLYSGSDSDIAAKWKGASFIIKRAAPGTAFALFGMAVMGITIWRGVQIPALPAQAAARLAIGAVFLVLQKAAKGEQLADREQGILAEYVAQWTRPVSVNDIFDQRAPSNYLGWKPPTEKQREPDGVREREQG